MPYFLLAFFTSLRKGFSSFSMEEAVNYIGTGSPDIPTASVLCQLQALLACRLGPLYRSPLPSRTRSAMHSCMPPCSPSC
jgi:hypothetical protein